MTFDDLANPPNTAHHDDGRCDAALTTALQQYAVHWDSGATNATSAFPEGEDLWANIAQQLDADAIATDTRPMLTVTDEWLNAYVDNALEDTEAPYRLAVEQQLAVDLPLAQRLGDLIILKEALASYALHANEAPTVSVSDSVMAALAAETTTPTRHNTVVPLRRFAMPWRMLGTLTASAAAVALVIVSLSALAPQQSSKNLTVNQLAALPQQTAITPASKALPLADQQPVVNPPVNTPPERPERAPSKQSATPTIATQPLLAQVPSRPLASSVAPSKKAPTAAPALPEALSNAPVLTFAGRPLNKPGFDRWRQAWEAAQRFQMSENGFGTNTAFHLVGNNTTLATLPPELSTPKPQAQMPLQAKSAQKVARQALKAPTATPSEAQSPDNMASIPTAEGYWMSQVLETTPSSSADMATPSATPATMPPPESSDFWIAI